MKMEETEAQVARRLLCQESHSSVTSWLHASQVVYSPSQHHATDTAPGVEINQKTSKLNDRKLSIVVLSFSFCLELQWKVLLTNEWSSNYLVFKEGKTILTAPICIVRVLHRETNLTKQVFSCYLLIQLN